MRRLPWWMVVLPTVLACRGPAPLPELPLPVPVPEAGLPPVPHVTGPLVLTVVYPPAGGMIDVRDSTFLFGSTGTGDAVLRVGDQPVRVAPNGSWLAWVGVPADSLIRVRVVASAAGVSAEVVHELRRAPRYRPPAEGPWIDTTSFQPSGRVWWPRHEPLPLSVRAAEGASVSLLLPNGTRVAFTAVATLPEVPEGIRAFDRDPENLARTARRDRYHATIAGQLIGEDLGPVLHPSSGPSRAASPLVEVVRGQDTVRARWPIRLSLLDGPVLAELDDDAERRGTTDGLTVGRALTGGTYHWFFPAGTRALVTGRINGSLRLGLSAGSAAWVDASEARAVADGAPSRAVVGSITSMGGDGRAVIRIPVSWRVPYQVDEDDRGLRLRLYGAASDINWVRYGSAAEVIDQVRWRQATADEVELEVRLSAPLWGYRLSWDRNDLLLEVRPRPRIEPGRPLAGRRIVVDPGHPPAGAVGPSGLTEAEANLGVARIVRQLLEAEGATVVMTREDDEPLGLWPRVRLADSLDADLEISIHNNAFPDGVNPLTNNGSSVFYFHPRSIPLARAIQTELVARLGLRDLGFARGDLALVRGTWMPSVLTEGLVMMVPEQEAALRAEAGRRRYAEAVVAGVRRFLAESGL